MKENTWPCMCFYFGCFLSPPPPSTLIPGARSAPVHLHLKWPSTFLPPPQSTFTQLKWLVCMCVRVHLSSKSSASLCAELMIILRSAPVLHKPLELPFTFYLQKNTRLAEPRLTYRAAQKHKRQTAQTGRERDGGQLKPVGPNRSYERLLEIDSGLVSPCTAVKLSRSACMSTHHLQLKLKTSFQTLWPSFLFLFAFLIHFFQLPKSRA